VLTFLRTVYEYNHVGVLRSITHSRGVEEIAGYLYGYDPVGRIRTVTTSPSSALEQPFRYLPRGPPGACAWSWSLARRKEGSRRDAGRGLPFAFVSFHGRKCVS
jgi:hypothetical protein